MTTVQTEVTRLLGEWRRGDPLALDRLTPLVYEELRRLAARHLGRERSDHSLDATELAHEAYLRLADKTHPNWRDRVHFFAVAAQQMRRILIDHARRHRSKKRGGSWVKLPLADVGDLRSSHATDLLALDEALSDLATIDPRKAKVLELRYFGGLTIEETAGFLGISTATVITDTRMARAWLHREMRRGAQKTGRPPERPQPAKGRPEPAERTG